MESFIPWKVVEEHFAGRLLWSTPRMLTTGGTYKHSEAHVTIVGRKQQQLTLVSPNSI